MRLFPLAAGTAVGLCAAATIAAGWTERYFGVGSGGDRGTACEQARGDAEQNSSAACARGHGARGEVSYTECVCATTWQSMHVCNVNVKVACDGPAASSPMRRGGEPTGRAGEESAAMHGAAPVRWPGPEVRRRAGTP